MSILDLERLERNPLRSESLAAAFSRKFDVELGALPLQIGIRRLARASDGNIHNDSRSQYVTALTCFSESCSQSGGRLRFLRRPDDIDSQFVLKRFLKRG